MIAFWARERGCDLARIARGYRRFAQERRHLLPLLVPNEEAVDAVSTLAGSPQLALAFLAMTHGLARLEVADAAWEAGVEAFGQRA
jgi:hypothetical protein